MVLAQRRLREEIRSTSLDGRNAGIMGNGEDQDRSFLNQFNQLKEIGVLDTYKNPKGMGTIT